MREELAVALKDAIRAKNATRLSTLRLISAAIKDRDLQERAARPDAEGDSAGVGDDEILQLLAKMIKQREESARAYDEGGRLELAERERAEIDVIQEFLPRQMSADEVSAAVSEIVTALEASTIRDMGRVMGELKSRYAGRMDFSAAGAQVKAALTQ